MALTFAPKEYRALEAAVHTNQQDALIPVGVIGAIPALDVTVVDIDPVMKEVATKWYDFKPSPLHRIVIEDGLVFVNQASDKGLKYDAILLDLCINKKVALMCPIEGFLTEEAISNLAFITADTGLLLFNRVTIVNIITAKDALFEAERVFRLYKQHFESCILLPAGGLDRVGSCSSIIVLINPKRFIADAVLFSQERAMGRQS
ncbi:hypothetical protein Y032_0131g1628 [Ancylostoma ceylanicum]|uniref:PABS domain-containing protein n=1 Tax=Ancylostoma ceylanicum TaxID=53326 RepID=A0A016T723_9BILA|nr:hypothetical protein Y032_0131g1628 [Ancylostoma ceylanicum]